MKTLIASIVLMLLVCCNAISQPYNYKGSELITIAFQTNPEVVKKLVPEPLVPNQEGIIALAIGIQRIESGLAYHEMYFAIPAGINGKEGLFIPIMYVDDAYPLYMGREIWGFPKYDAKMTFVKDDKQINASISKNGKLLLDVTLVLGNDIPGMKGPDPLVFVLKNIPAIEENMADVKKLNSAILSNYTYLKYQQGSAKMTINYISDGFIGEIPVINILDASYSVVNFTLGFGKTEHDYLKQ